MAVERHHPVWSSLVMEVEHRLGPSLGETRPDERPRAIELLGEAGALELRNGVSTMACPRGVSRCTVYGDLHAHKATAEAADKMAT